MVFTALPTVVMLIALKCNWRDVGLKPRYWGLTGILLGITILFGLIWHSSLFLQMPLYQVVAAYFVQLLIWGLPEELLLRGFVLPRLELLLTDPINAIVLMSMIFTLLQIPSSILFRNWLFIRMNITTALYYLSPLSHPTGLIWGYLYLRTRSIVPGMLWHAANGEIGGILGNIFFVLR
jgi:membrane protease YdiL (CAAX protease family)